MDPVHGLTGALGALVFWGLLSVVAGKDPYLDFTCVASQALIPTATSTAEILIEAYTPLRDATFEIAGIQGKSTQTDKDGAYVCSLETENIEATTTVIVSSEDASLYPPRLTVTLDPDEEKKLQMLLRDDCVVPCRYKWRELVESSVIKSNEKELQIGGLNEASVVLRNFLVDDKEKKGFVQVLVRECPSGYWNPVENCSLECSMCLNGGMCHPRSGQCICPPGFSGEQCEIVHGRNIFGQKGQYSCSTSSDPHEAGCMGKLFCLPEPFGCTCAAGYRGISCSEGCKEGMYGANCEGVCHCEDNSTCLADTGECVRSLCQEGWCGTNCQVPAPMLYKELKEVKVNHATNVTCILENVKNPTDSDIVLILPDGTSIEADYIIEYETPVMAEYSFVVADARDNKYTCAYNNIRLQKTVYCNAFVQDPTLSEELKEVNINQTTNITCILGKVNNPTDTDVVLILPNGTAIEADDIIKSEISIKTEYIFVVVADARENEYTCTNANATLQKKFNLPAFEPPYLSNPPTITSSKVNEVTITWNPWETQSEDRGDPPVLEYIITYKDANVNGTTKAGTTQGDTTLYTVVGLMEDTEYEFRVTAVRPGVGGAGPPSPPAQGNTACLVPGKPVNLTGVPLNATSLQLNWSRPINTNCTVITYKLTYWLMQQGDCSPVAIENFDKKRNTTGNHSLVIDDLLPDTVYEMKIVAITSAGSSKPLLDEKKTSESVPGPPIIVDVKIESFTLPVEWEAPNCADRNGKILGYHYQLLISGEMIAEEGVTKSSVRRHTFENVLPCTEYGFRVRGWTSAGNGIFSQIQNVTTPSAVPGNPVNFTGVALNATSLQLNWSRPINTNCTVITYKLTYWLMQQGNCPPIAVENFDKKRNATGNHSLVIGDLLPDTLYNVIIKAKSDAGVSAGDTWIKTKTNESVPGIPVANDNTLTSSRSLTFTWQPPACRNRNGVITKYYCKLVTTETSKLFKEISVSPDVTSATFDGLTACTEYRFKVLAQTSAGNGSFSGAVTVTTDGEAPDAVGDLQTEPQATSIHLNWTQPSDTSCSIISYRVTYKLIKVLQCLEEENATFQEVVVIPLNTQHTIFGLLPASKYVVSVSAETKGGLGERIKKEVVTNEYVPGIPVAINNTLTSSRSVTFTWQPPACRNRNGTITGYTYKLVNTATKDILTEMSVSPNVTSATFEELTACTKYHFKVQARTSVTYSAFSNATYVTTDGEVPDVVSNVQASPTSDSIEVTWQPPTNISCNITSYVVSYKLVRYRQCSAAVLKSQEYSVMVESTSWVYTIQELSAASDYLVSVRANTTSGLGDEVTRSVSTPQSVPGKPVAINNTLTSSRSVTFTWQPPTCRNRNGIITGYTYKLVDSAKSDKLTEMSVPSNVSSATFDGLTACTKYHFKVLAQTSVGISSFSSAAYVTTDGEVPDVVSNIQASPTSDSIQVTWEPPTNVSCDITSFVISYKLVRYHQCSAAVLMNQEYSVIVESTSMAYTIQELSAASDYLVTVRANTTSGLGDEVTRSVSTPQSVPGIPVAINNTLTSSRSVTFTWQPPACRNRNGIITGYIYKLVNTAKSDMLTETSVSPNVTSATFDGLTACTKYHFIVLAQTSVGNSSFSDAAYVTTDGEVPDVVSNVLASPTSDSIQVTWQPPTNISCNITSYVISYKLVRYRQCLAAVLKSEEYSVMVESTSMAYTIQELSAASDYLVSVRANTTSGLGNEVNRNVSTPESAPKSVTNVTLTDVGPFNASFSWSPPVCEDTHGTILLYSYYLALSEEGVIAGNTTNEVVSFGSLKPCTFHNFTVAARTSAGMGNQSQPLNFTTNVTVPGQVATPTKKGFKNATAVRIQWGSLSSAENPCSIENYTITYYLKEIKQCKKTPNETFIKVTTDTEILLVDLRPKSVYKVAVKASTLAGEGALSMETKVLTDFDAPGQITDVMVSNTTMDSIQFTWSELDCKLQHDAIDMYKYEFKVAESDDNDNYDDDDDWERETSDLFARFTGLKPCTDFEFRVQAIGKRKEGIWSEWVKAITSTAVPEKVENLVLQPGDNPSSIIEVTWQPSNNDSCMVDTYKVMYTGESLEACSPHRVFNSTSTAVKANNATLSDLRPYSKYNITVRGKTSAGLGKINTKVRQTAQSIPEAPPEDITLVDKGPNHFNFTWQPPICGQQNGLITNYAYTLVESIKNETVKNNTVAMTKAFLDDLLPFVDYNFTVAANTKKGSGPPGHLVVKTAEGAPSPPRKFRAVKSETTSLKFTWDPPDPPTGIISAYQFMYWHSGLEEDLAVSVEYEVETTNPHRYRLEGLKPYTDYNIKIRGKTGAGFGNWSGTLRNRTAEGAPEQPANVAVIDRTTTTLAIQWKGPENINGVLRGYKMKYRIVDQPFVVSSSGSDTEEVNISSGASRHTLEDLKPATGYEIKLAALTVHYGVYSTLTPIYTKIPDIAKPKMLDAPSVGDDNIVTLQLEAMDSPYISVYQVTVAKLKSESTISRREVGDSTLGSYQQSQDEYITAEFNKTALPSKFKVGNNKTYNGYYNAPLEPGTNYGITFCGVGKTKQDTNPSCSEPSAVKTRELGTGMEQIVAVIVGILVVMAIVVVVLVVIVRRRRQADKTDNTNGITLSNLEKAKPRTNGVPNQSAVVEELVRTELKRSGGVKGKATTPVPHPSKVSAPPKRAWKPHKPVLLQELPEYIKKKKAKGNKGFSHDFASLPDEQLFSCDVAQKEEQRCKNRYANIIPYDCTRVLLDVLNDNQDTDFVNASYIDGYQREKAYIATQGPNKSSSPDFWRMVWEQEVTIVVMLTNLVENAKKKCIQYWPDEQQNYGDIVVKLVSEKVKKDFTERSFVISNINIDEDIPREIKQFHYTSWPDMGLPDSPAPLMKFIHEVKQNENDKKPSPMVVHCSAGVGRTGTFITVDAMLNMVAEEKQMNIIDFVYQMRRHRMKMVQTVDQYMFIFEVLVETLLCGETVMEAETFPTQYTALHEHNPLTGNTYVEEHFRVLDTMSVAPSDDNCHGGRNEMNVSKNRFHDCIPLDKCRPYLMSPGEDDNSTNYINASFIDAYKKKDGFLATQSPLPNTVVDFWRMIYDYNARVIVMLNEIEESEDESLQPYWLDNPEETAALGIFELQLRDCKDFSHTIARTFKLKNTNKISEKPRTIHHFEFKKWKEEEEFPESIVSFVGFLELVEQGQRQSGGDGRTAVHCLDGVTRSGIFCATMVALKKLKEEKVIDIFHAVRNLRRNRDVMVESQDQYLFCYEVLKMYLEENETYANFR